jgi:prepilin signal peptidase PulO-like enzyme (type II secretory pathway)
MILAIIILAWFGLAFGSFVNALVWRIHEQSRGKKKNSKVNLSIINGRSICPSCKHMLAWYDLIPVFSWLYLHGRCRYCKKTISVQYPLVELATAFIFVCSYLFWPDGLHFAGNWVLFITWLATSVGLVALLVYDLRWMLLPNRIIYPTAAIAALGRAIYIIGYSSHAWHDLLAWAASIAVASGIFWLIFVVSNGKWIGFGDVRLGLITGTVLASPAKSFLMIFIGSVLGTLFIIPALLTGNKTVNSKLPYGPFLIMGCAVTLLFGGDILDWYKHTFLP